MPPVRPPLGELQFHLFSRPLHPELFEVQAARVVEFDGARVEVRILPEGHWISWKRAQGWASEVATVNSQPPSPAMATTGRSGAAIAAPMAMGSAHPSVPNP